MKKLIKKMKQIMAYMRLDKKMWAFFAFFIILVSVLVSGVTLKATTSMMIKNTRDIAAQKIDIIDNSIEQELNALASQGQGLAMNSSIQSFLKGENVSENEKLANEVRSVMQTVLDGQPNLNMIEIFEENGDKVFFRSYNALYDARFLVKEEYKNAMNAGRSNIKVLYNNKFSISGGYTLTFYMPIFDTSRLNHKIGILAMDLDCSKLAWVGMSKNSELPFETYILDKDGHYFLTDETSKLGSKAAYAGQPDVCENGKIVDKTLYIYRPVGNWNFYLVGKISTNYIFNESSRIILFIILLVAVILLIFFAVGFRLVKHLYAPMDKVVRAMAQINETNMDIRLSTDMVGEDFKKVAAGFNNMLNRLTKAMETIKEEQQQIQMLRFSALQSQIQPHFLYNTLECIHWQAAALGSQELSTMVKALANYYRIVLSKGKDVIPLEEELEHVNNYITIQNLRYEDIIDYEVSVEECFLQYKIPKITLQPLVENSIYHGIRIKEGNRGKIRITAKADNQTFTIFVEDNGEEITGEKIEMMNKSLEKKDETFGYGIQNVNKRIQLVFGSAYGLHYELGSLNKKGVLACIVLPRGQEAEEV